MRHLTRAGRRITSIRVCVWCRRGSSSSRLTLRRISQRISKRRLLLMKMRLAKRTNPSGVPSSGTRIGIRTWLHTPVLANGVALVPTTVKTCGSILSTYSWKSHRRIFSMRSRVPCLESHRHANSTHSLQQVTTSGCIRSPTIPKSETNWFKLKGSECTRRPASSTRMPFSQRKSWIFRLISHRRKEAKFSWMLIWRTPNTRLTEIWGGNFWRRMLARIRRCRCVTRTNLRCIGQS